MTGGRDAGPADQAGPAGTAGPASTAEALRASWWAAVASVTRMTGDLAIAEDAVQDACVAALTQWPACTPADPRGWLIGVARHKALDLVRREARRGAKEEAAVRELGQQGPPAPEPAGDELGLIFMCCHPALALEAQVALTLRCVCGLSTAQIAAAFLVPEATMAKRLSRARNKIRVSGIRLRTPGRDELAGRVAAVPRVVYLVFTEGHKASTGPALVRGELCDAAIGLARGLAALLPGEPEVTGLLALLLLTDARRATRCAPDGRLLLLEEQDRTQWDRPAIGEGTALVREALRGGRPGRFALQAAIAALHAQAPSYADTDWRQILLLYDLLGRAWTSPVVTLNRAVALAMADGPEAGLAEIGELERDGRLAGYRYLPAAKADLLRRLGRLGEAAQAYRAALELTANEAERSFLSHRLAEVTATQRGG
jgi:RNA polymerase sigma-70 factor, ECF subfamily